MRRLVCRWLSLGFGLAGGGIGALLIGRMCALAPDVVVGGIGVVILLYAAVYLYQEGR